MVIINMPTDPEAKNDEAFVPYYAACKEKVLFGGHISLHFPDSYTRNKLKFHYQI